MLVMCLIDFSKYFKLKVLYLSDGSIGSSISRGSHVFYDLVLRPAFLTNSSEYYC
jgi:hypothetical protein